MRDPKQVESGRVLDTYKGNDSEEDNDDSSGSEVMVEKTGDTV
jgi:hypothetical protein